MDWLRKVRDEWRAHKWSFLISLVVTLLGIALYTATYLGHWDWALLKFLDNIELKSYDTRFKVRGITPPAPEIVIVTIDQATLGRLGSWPFSRRHFATLLERLGADGAKVVGFDINFPKPDEKSALRAIQEIKAEYAQQVAQGQADPEYLRILEAREQEADTDRIFAEAIREAGNAVLGYFFLFAKQEVGYIDEEAQEEIDSYLSFSTYSVQPLKDKRRNLPPPLAEIFVQEKGFLEAYLVEANLPLFTEAVEYNVGHFYFEADADGIFRHSPLVIRYGAAWQQQGSAEVLFCPSLDIQILRRYLDVPEHYLTLLYNKAGVEGICLGEFKDGCRGRRIPTDPQGRLLVHYQGGPFTYPHISMADVVEGTFAPGTFRDKIVLVGPTALGIGDFHPTPFAESNFSGVEIHANILDTVLNQRFIHRGSREEIIDLLSILLFGLAVGFILARVSPSLTTPVTLAVLVVFLAFTYVALVHYQVWLNVIVPGSVLVANFGAVTAYRVFVEDRAKRKTRAAFAQYVPPGLIREMMKDPGRLKLGGEERELTIMFSDIRGFTALSERLTPLELTGFLNSYTDEMTDIIFKHWGTLDKFEGDAIMAFWGAPYEQEDHSLRACAAALDMGQRVDELRQQWRAEGKPDVNVGLGLNSGRVVVGNMGSRKRFNYTVLGDPVNLASRLEGVNKEYTTRIIVSEFTHRQASDALGSLIKRVSRQFGLSPEQLAVRDGSSQARRARQLALYVGATKRLAAPKVLAQRFGDAPEQPEETVRRAIAQVEKWEARDKKIARFLTECRRSFHTFVFRQLDWIRVKGKREPVAIHELLDYAGQDGSAQGDWDDLLTLFESGLQAYRAQKWDFATDIFQTLLEKYPDDKPTKVFLARCREFSQEPPPPAWDGVYVMKTK